jgi:hypothetical protein
VGQCPISLHAEHPIVFRFVYFLGGRLEDSEPSVSEHSPSVSCDVQSDILVVASGLRVEGSISEERTDKRKGDAKQITSA